MATKKIKSAEADLLKQIKVIEDKYGQTLGVNRGREWDVYRKNNFALSDDLTIKSNVDRRDEKYKSFNRGDETWTAKQQELATAGQQVFELKQKLSDVQGNVIDKVRSGLSRKTVSGKSRYSLEREQLLIGKYPKLFASGKDQTQKEVNTILNNSKDGVTQNPKTKVITGKESNKKKLEITNDLVQGLTLE
tara:strand:+ start:268 stop:840 length:573 start_codon:yes stop_codon:yes gene_type:complete